MYLKDKAKLLTDLLKEKGADDGSSLMSLSEMNEIYYESGKVSLMRTVFSESASVMYIKDQKVGNVSTNKTSPEDLKKACEDAAELSEQAQPDKWRRSADHSEVKSVQSGPMAMDQDKMYERLIEFIETATREYPLIKFESCAVVHDKSRTIWRNLKGAEITEEKGYYDFSTVFSAVDGDKTSSFNYFSHIMYDLDRPLIEEDDVRRTLGEVSQQTDLKSLEGDGGTDVIIAPSALSDFLIQAIYNFAGSFAVMTETGKWREMKGQKVSSPLLTASLNPLDFPGAMMMSKEGYMNENMPLIENGVLKNLVISDYAALRSGREKSPNQSYFNIKVSPGNTKLSDMIKDVKKGILLNRFSGGSPSPAGDIAGIAKNSFFIEDGKITGAASETMIAGNLEEVFENIVSISEETVNNGVSEMPFIRTTGFKISGK